MTIATESTVLRHLGRLALCAVVACTIAGGTTAALADDAGSETPAEPAATSEPDAGGNAQPTGEAAAQNANPSPHGLRAAPAETTYANDAAINATANGACGLFAENGGVIIANALTVQTQGAQGAAVATARGGGSISIANSQLSTSGDDAPLLLSAGIVEADNVSGQSLKSPIARIEGNGAMLIEGSTLASSYESNAADSLPANGIALYRTDTQDATKSQVETAVFQANGSTFKSSIASGSMFYLTNTTASILLSDTTLDFDTGKAKLLVAAGSDVPSTVAASGKDIETFGATGKNGATATFTARNQRLDGDIEVDSISSLDYYLLEGSEWAGTTAITANSAGTALASNIVVNIDATSGWVVTDNSTVSKLNIEKGGKLVDADGKSVTIVDADGNKLVDGASNVTVSVKDEFSTTVKTSEANKPRAAGIDRAAFDERYGTSTAFGTNGADPATADAQRVAYLQNLIREWFANL